jgi:CRP-like cAMP-binding protein
MERRVDAAYRPNPLVRRLATIAELSPDEEQALHGLPLDLRDLRADQDIVRDGDRPSQCCLILEGFVCRYKLLLDGRRQILSFHVPGDIPDLQSLHLVVMDHSLGTLAPTRAAMIQHDALRNLIARHPRLGDVFWRESLIDAAVFREWMIGIGRRSAHARIAHLLCELFLRFKTVGLTRDQAFDLPVTQIELGDALGLSTVHVNRVLQELRGAELITMRAGTVSVRDWAGLKAAGEFDPAYLHLRAGWDAAQVKGS